MAALIESQDPVAIIDGEYWMPSPTITTSPNSKKEAWIKEQKSRVFTMEKVRSPAAGMDHCDTLWEVFALIVDLKTFLEVWLALQNIFSKVSEELKFLFFYKSKSVTKIISHLFMSILVLFNELFVFGGPLITNIRVSSWLWWSIRFIE